MTPEKGTYRVTVESLPVLVSNGQSILSHSNSWRANLPHFHAAALSGGQEIPPLLWPLSPRLIACVLLCSWKCCVYWLDASFSMTRLTFRLLNWHKAQADWQCRGNNLHKCVGLPTFTHRVAEWQAANHFLTGASVSPALHWRFTAVPLPGTPHSWALLRWETAAQGRYVKILW